jgi:hypothetical protein
MLLKEALLRDPSKNPLVNNGEASIQNEAQDEKMLLQLRGELCSFVCKGQYGDGMLRILDSFLRGRSQPSQKGAWVSGFYGSGKSHLLKMLCHLWRDTVFSDGATARSLVPDLPQDVRSALRELDITGRKSGGLLAAAGKLPSGTSDLVRQSVLAILLRAVDLPEQYPLAQFHLWLEEQGFLATVKSAVEAAGKPWQQELGDLYVSPIIREALLQCDPNFASSKAQVGETLRKQFPLRTADLTSAEFLSMFQRVLKRAGNGGKVPCTVFILDEVQQYIGTSVERSVIITEIAEAIQKQMDCQVMLVCAGQSALTGQELLAKMLDRFLIRVQLSDTDVEVVTREVLLQKKPTARSEVETLLSRNAGEVSRQLQDTKIGQRTSDQDTIVDDYPLLPVRRRFWEECFRQVDAAGTQSQLRSQLGIIHESLERLADCPLGTVIPADELYALLASKLMGTGVLPRGIYDRISALPDPLSRRVCGLVFLIGQLKTEAGADIGVRASAEHIADLLVQDLTADNGKLRSDVAAQLSKLADAGVLMRVGTEYRIQTEEGRAWDDEFRKRETKFKNNAADFDEQRDQLLAAEVDKALKGIKLIQGQAKVSRSLLTHRGQDAPQVTGDTIPVWIRDGFSSTEKAMTDAAIAAGMDSPTIYVFIPKKSREELLSAIAAFEAAHQTIQAKGAPATQEGELAKSAMESRRKLAETARNNLVAEIVGAAKVFRGGGSEVFGLALDAKFKSAGEDSLVRLFPQFIKADAPAAAWESCIKRARAGQEQPFQPLKYEGPIEQHPVCQQVRQTISSGKTGTQIRKELEAAPFGWPRDAVDAALIALHSSQQIIATSNGAPVERGQLDQNRIPKAEFRLEKTNVSLDDRLKLRKLFQTLEIACKSGEESDKAPDFIRAALALAADAGGDAPLPLRPSVTDLQDIQNQVGNDRLAGLRDISASLTARIADWKKAKALIGQRQPAWEIVGRLSAHAAALGGADAARKQVEAVRAGRLLLDPIDPLPALRSTLTTLLRQALNDVYSAHETAYTDGMAQIAADPIWQRLTAPQQDAILRDSGLAAPVKPDTGTDTAILTALDARNLATRKAEVDAVAGRVANALKAAAILLEPKVRPVAVEKALLKTPDDVRQWAERQQNALLLAVEKGPIQVQ